MSFSGKVAFVTGAGSGIGRAVCLALFNEGAIIVAADVSEISAKETAALVKQKGGEAWHQVVDVTNIESLQGSIENTIQKYKRFDICCNNAGVGEDVGFEFTNADNVVEHYKRWKRMVDINLTAVMTGTQLAIQAMRKLGNGGIIINTASMGGMFPMPFAPVYAGTKSGVIHFSRSLKFLESENIRVNAICPGFAVTPLIEKQEGFKDHASKLQGGLLTVEKVAEGFVQLCKDTSKAGAVMRVTPAKGIDYYNYSKL